METINFTKPAQYRFVKWLLSNIAKPKDHYPRLECLKLEPYIPRVTAMNRFSGVFAELSGSGNLDIFGAREGYWVVTRIDRKSMDIEKVEPDYPDLSPVMVINDNVKPHKLTAFTTSLLLDIVKPFESFNMLLVGKDKYFIKMDYTPNCNLPEGEYYAVLMGQNFGNYGTASTMNSFEAIANRYKQE